jgi:hypothetical protein
MSEVQNRIRKHCEPANTWKGIVVCVGFPRIPCQNCIDDEKANQNHQILLGDMGGLWTRPFLFVFPKHTLPQSDFDHDIFEAT